MKSTEKDKLLSDFLEGTLSESRRQEALGVWGDTLHDYATIWEKSSSVASFHQIDLEADREKTATRLFGPAATPAKTHTVGRVKLLVPLLRIAALFVLAFGILFLLDRTVVVNESCGELQTKQIELPDGSKVTLNSGASLSYRYFPFLYAQRREVELKGEGYFEMKPQNGKVFCVNTGTATVEVIGTIFNVNEQEKYIFVSVISGKVALVPPGKPSEKIVLAKSQMAVYNAQTNQIEHVGNISPNSAAWKTGRLFFENTPLEDAVRDISHAYQQPVVADSRLKSRNLTLTAVYDNEKLEDIIDEICLVLDVRAVQHSDTIFIVGK